MTADTNEEIAQLVEAACYSLAFLVFGVWGLLVGGYIPGFYGRKSSPKRQAHRTVLWAVAAGAFAGAYGLWVLSEEGGDFIRSDGRTAEYARQIAIGVASLAMVYAYAVYSRYTASGTRLALFFTFALYLFATLTTVTSNDILQWISLSFWLVALIVLALFGFASINIHPTWIYGNYIAGFIFLVFVMLQGLWLILSEQVAREISTTVEAALYTGTDIILLGAFGLIVGFTFPASRALVGRGGNGSIQMRQR
jgi:hypothetical protein